MKNYAAAVVAVGRSRVPFRNPSRRTRGVTIAALVPVLLAAGCGGDEEAAPTTTTAAVVTTAVPSSTTTAPVTTTAVTTTTDPGGAVDPDTVPTTSAGGVVDPVPDGTGFGYVTSVSVAESTVSIDVAELLTGDEAVKAAVADGALEPGETSIPNDYYVRNRNPKVRVAPVGPSAGIGVLEDDGGPDISSASLAQLAASVAATSGEDGPRLPVQFVATGGVIERIDEMYFP